MNEGKEKRFVTIEQIEIVMVFVFFVFMMLYNLQHSALWGDEWVEYHYSQKNIFNGDMYRAIISTFQPPLYNFIMYFWLSICDSIFWFRSFNIIIGLISGIFLYQTLKHMTNHYFAVITLLILGMTYQWIYCIQECSEYSLMLMFIFGAIHFFIKVENKYNLKAQILFILFCISAMYSQYGAFFIVMPLITIHYIGILKDKNKFIIQRTTINYIGAFVIFALPLFFLFAKIQMGHNEIGINGDIGLLMNSLKDIPLVFGNLLGYFFNINIKQSGTMQIIVQLLGILILFVGSVVVLSKKEKYVAKKMIIVMYVAYILYYILIVFQVYGMVHPNQSSGFYSRYGYFFIPLFSIVFPTIFYEAMHLFGGKCYKFWLGIVMLFFLLLSVNSFPAIIENWHKSYDDKFAQIWINNAGFNDTTYLIGAAHYGFDYYITGSGCEIQGEIINAKYEPINQSSLPKKFWLWRTNWSGDAWQDTIEAAEKQGYIVTIYANHGYSGQLAMCRKNFY